MLLYYSMIYYVLNLLRGLFYVEIFYIVVVMGEDWCFIVYIMFVDVDFITLEREKWRGEIRF